MCTQGLLPWALPQVAMGEPGLPFLLGSSVSGFLPSCQPGLEMPVSSLVWPVLGEASGLLIEAEVAHQGQMVRRVMEGGQAVGPDLLLGQQLQCGPDAECLL